LPEHRATLSNLFFRTASQALQALLPIAFGFTWFRRNTGARATTGISIGLFVALLITPLAAWLFQSTTHQAFYEAALATGALAAVIATLHRSATARSVPAMLAATTTVLVTRQMMEVAAVFAVAAFELHSADAIVAIASATALVALMSSTWIWVAGHASERASRTAEVTFATLFIAQLGMYAFHESAEARLLPWSETLHAMTEPYGPDGLYGETFSWLLIVLPLAAATIVALRRQASHIPVMRNIRARPWVFASIALLALGDGVSLRSADVHPAAPAEELAALARPDHVLFRHTDIDDHYNTLSLAPLSDPTSRRASTGILCERVSFAAGRGICLQASRRVLTTYRAIIFDDRFNTVGSLTLAGSPSRTRVAPDGRVGAITVFVAGHAYSNSQFSTKTTLVDMATGDPLGDLEDFTTWRDGVRIKAQDFNFWGVTFRHDGNTFYATLGTGGTTYLVQGDLGLRKLRVLRGNVECPSLSPDERHIAFKTRTSDANGKWRLAVLDVATLSDRLIPGETRNIDDQVEWLDNRTVLYAVPRSNSAVTDVWMTTLDGQGAPSIFLPAAESPTVVHHPR
jgi:hypothetical protein